MSRLVQPWLAANLSKTLDAATNTAKPIAVPQTDQGELTKIQETTTLFH
jgi:hypothetical protein